MQIDLEQIHEASLNILRKTGVQLDHPEIVEVVKKHGIQVSEQVAYFTGPQVMEWIQKECPPERLPPISKACPFLN